MATDGKRYKIVYCTPALYMAGGVERVLTMKANYFAEVYGYDITIVLTEGKTKTLFYPLSDRVNVVNLDLNFEELWSSPFLKKVFIYLYKQHRYKRRLADVLSAIQPDITVSLLRREVNFITKLKDGSKKVGELHINRANYRNFSQGSNAFLNLFSKFWMKSLVSKLQNLDKLVVLTEKDKEAWKELNNVVAIPNPLPISSVVQSSLTEKRVIAIGRYSYEKGFDHLLKAWSEVQNICQDWRLDVFGDGDRAVYEQIIDAFQIDRKRCVLHERTTDVQSEYLGSSIAVCSSRFEGFGLTIIEAMACGVPVVSYNCPWGPGAIISDGNDGVLVENQNVSKLAEGMVTLMTNKELLMDLAQNAVKNVRRFKIEQIAHKWKELFESL